MKNEDSRYKLVDVPKIGLLVVVCGLIISLVLSTIYTNVMEISWTITGLSILFTVLLCIYAYILYKTTKARGTPIVLEMARKLASTVIPLLLFGLSIFVVNVPTFGIVDPSLIRILNAIFAGILALLYLIIFPLTLPESVVRNMV